MDKCEYCIYRIEKEYSKSQFNMVWAKIQEIADILRISKYEVYRQCLKDYGQSTIFQVDAEGRRVLMQQYAYTEELSEGIIQAWKGIEYMSSKELSIFTDGVIEELNNVRN